MSHKIIFVIDLIQDYSVQINLIHSCLNENQAVCVAITDKFMKRDKHNIFYNRVVGLSVLGVKLIGPLAVNDLIKEFSKYSGVIFTSSESSLPNHKDMYQLINELPERFKTITLQHGFENVGLLENKDTRNVFDYENIDFASSEIWGYIDRAKVNEGLKIDYRQTDFWNLSKEQDYATNFSERDEIVLCDSIHSPKFTSQGKFSEFINFTKMVSKFAEKHQKKVVLRPHPGKFAGVHPEILPYVNEVNAKPLNESDFSKTLMLISTASTICVDATMRNVPCWLWSNSNRVNVENFTWLQEFSDDIEVDKEFLEAYAQNSKKRLIATFMSSDSIMPIEKLLKENFADVSCINKMRYKVCIFSNSGPTLSARFALTMAEYRNEKIFYNLNAILILLSAGLSPTKLYQKIARRLGNIGCKVCFIVRHSYLPEHDQFHKCLKAEGIRIVYFTDDDLGAITPDLGEKYNIHRSVENQRAIQGGVQNSDLVFTSTEHLMGNLTKRYKNLKLRASNNFSIGNVTKKYPTVFSKGKVITFGYSGVGHQFDLQQVLPQIVTFMELYPNVVFEFYGILPPEVLIKKFQNRIKSRKSNTSNYNFELGSIDDNYLKYRKQLSKLNWHFGICPLAPSDFNRCKSDVKMFEYLDSGILPIASNFGPYSTSRVGGNCILVDYVSGWLNAFEKCMELPVQKRIEMVLSAQKKMEVMTYREARSELNTIIEDTINAKV